MQNTEKQLLVSEVRELTELLRYDSSMDLLREEIIKRGVDVDTCLLAGMIESEKLETVGVIVVSTNEVWYFETDASDKIIRWDRVMGSKEIQNLQKKSFRALSVAVETI